MVELPLEDLKEMLGVADKYDLYGHFKAAVLEEALKRLTDTTDISFTYQEVKKGRKVVAIVFHIRETGGGHLTREDTPKIKPIKPDKGQTVGVVNTEHERLLVDLTPLVCTNWGVTPKMLRSLIEHHTAETIQQAIRVTENALAQGKVKEAAGFFVQAVRQGYNDTEGGRKEKVQQQKTHIDAQKQLEIEQKQQIARQKQLDFEKDKTVVLALLAEDTSLRSEVINRLHGGILRGSYDDAKSFDDNMKTPLLLGAVLNIVKNIKEN
jgi:hypothetical protein